MSEIVVIGSINMDFVVKADRAPRGGETLPGREFHTFFGGKGANQAVAAARLGGDVAMLGKVGNDFFGDQLIAGLRKDHVDISRIKKVQNAHSGMALIVVEAGGENRILVVPGANGQVNPEDIDSATDFIGNARLVIMQFEIPLPTVKFVLEKAWQVHIPVLLNPAPAFQIGPDYLELVTYLVLNENEAETLTGKSVKTMEGAQRAVKSLCDAGPDLVVLTLGAQGGIWANKNALHHFPAFRVPTVDTTGAGDAFIGGLAVAIQKGFPVAEMIRFAGAAGALATTKLGAQDSLPYREDVEKLINVSTGSEI